MCTYTLYNDARLATHIVYANKTQANRKQEIDRTE